MTTLSGTVPVVVDLREDSNNQYDFLAFLTYLVECNHLTAGDYLICDNATVHAGSATIDLILQLLASAGVTLVFLPAYSPELNPCELVFSFIKQKVRRSQFYRTTLWFAVLQAVASVPADKVVSFYKHCIHTPK